MDVVNFAHGEFLRSRCTRPSSWFAFFAIDPLLARLVAGGAVRVRRGGLSLIVRFAMRAKANAGMVQDFRPSACIVMRGLAQFFFHAGLSQHHAIPARRQTISVGGIYLPEPQLMGALVSIVRLRGAHFFIHRTDFGRALEATAEDNGAVALVASTRTGVFALGWGLGAALVGLAGAIMAMFFYVLS